MKPPSGPKKTNPIQSQLPVPTCRVSYTLWGVFLPLLQDLYILYPLQGTKITAMKSFGLKTFILGDYY